MSQEFLVCSDIQGCVDTNVGSPDLDNRDSFYVNIEADVHPKLTISIFRVTALRRRRRITSTVTDSRSLPIG